MPHRVGHNQKAFRSTLLRVLHAKLLCLLHLLLETLKKWTTPCSPSMLIGAMTDLTRSKSGLLLENAREVKKPHPDGS
jgi:hypothetical protein